MRQRIKPWNSLLASAGLCLLAACSGSGGSGSSTTPGAQEVLQILSISVQEGSLVPLNRSIEIIFAEAVDFTSVNSASIQISDEQGRAAVGSFMPRAIDTTGDGRVDALDPSVVVWQPACPLLPDYSDAGLTAGELGNSYTLRLRGLDSNSASVLRGISGRELAISEVRNFRTPASSDPAVLFEDPTPGAPLALVRTPGSTIQVGTTYVELGGDSDPATHLYFERDDSSSTSSVIPGAGVTTGVLVPFNNLADPAAALSFVVAFNQPLAPDLNNMSDRRIRLEYLLPSAGAQWIAIDSQVSLLQNCQASGALVRVKPIGLLPASSQLRLAVLRGFQGLSGLLDATPTEQVNFAVVSTRDLDHTPLPYPMLGADELFEDFDLGGELPGSLEDTQAELLVPAATWGQGSLKSQLNFVGTGGENGDFDWVISQKPEVFDTSNQIIVGGPGGEARFQQFTHGGVADVHDFIILDGAELQIRGPNPFVVNATGEIRIEGLLNVNGGAARNVGTLNTGNQPEPGGTGIAGGGDGGTGSPIRQASSIRGGQGFGPFGGGLLGGVGGESGYARAGLPSSLLPNSRRPGGGGGGRFAADQSDITAASVQTSIPTAGMLARPGKAGNMDAIGGVSRVRPAPGGTPGAGPFVDGDPSNDFRGMRVDTHVAILMDGSAPVLQSVGAIISGELSQLHAGYGGGAGGDAAKGPIFPTPNWTISSDEKAGGGGGGAGAVQLRALGPIRFVGPSSQLQCRGATGATGENIIFLERVGGSGGSGSGGHVVLESATKISFELPPLSARPPSQRRHIFVDARGFRGVVGCLTNGNGIVLPVGESNGGDGGPGVIQLHVPDATSPPHEDVALTDIVLPEGTIEELSAGQVSALLEVMRPAGIQMLPGFGSISGAQSRWVDVQNAGLNPDGSQNLLSFLFDGIDPLTGRVLTTRGQVPDLAAILSGTLDANSGSFDGQNSLILSALAIAPMLQAGAPLGSDIYLRSPVLLRNFVLRMSPTIGISLDFPVQGASYDASLQELRLTVARSSGVDLITFDTPGSNPSYALIPKFFGISSNAVQNALPDGTSVRFSFEGTSAAANGLPDDVNILVPETSDLSEFLNVAPGQLDFIRFKVEFDINTNTGIVDLATPGLELDFLRLPFLY